MPIIKVTINADDDTLEYWYGCPETVCPSTAILIARGLLFNRDYCADADHTIWLDGTCIYDSATDDTERPFL